MPGKAVHLTQDPAEVLWWVTSADEKFARNLMKMNQIVWLIYRVKKCQAF